MFVIFPAEELILMTYGAAIPRISPRPTLDCLREPQVPIIVPARSLPPSSSQSIKPPIEPPAAAVTLYQTTLSAVPAAALANNFTQGGEINSVQRTYISPTVKNTIGNSQRHSYENRAFLPTISESCSASEFSANPITTSATPPRRSSRTSLKRSTPVQRTPLALRKIEKSPLGNESVGNLKVSLHDDLTMRSSQRKEYPPSAPNAGYQPSTMEPEYPTGSLQQEPSVNIYLDPASPDPTRPRLGPGWGRPMSPMELPPEPSTSQKSPSSNSRLRPKLHIPLGRLGRSTSSDQKESHRLREDLELRVENPVFNTENLRQRNFDAFFDSGEPVYKLQPKTPHTVGGVTTTVGKSAPPLDNYAGVYDSSPRKVRGAASGSLFARSKNEGQLSASRSRSTEQYDPAIDDNATSLASGSAGTATAGSATGVPQKDFLGKSSSGPKSRSFFGWRGPRSGAPNLKRSMASNANVLKDYGHCSFNEAFKSQNNVNFKLIKTVADFTETLSHLYEEHATALQTLVASFRKRNAELRKERPACHLSIFQAWETFLQEVETDSQASNDVANILYRQVSRPLLDKSFHRKVQSRKIFTHRESFETIIAKTEEKLSKCRLDYKQRYVSHRQYPTPHSLTEYVDAHNAYVQQLHATNAMLETYQCETMPQLMEELEEVHNDLCSIISESIQQGADVIASKASDQAKRYGSLITQCTSVTPAHDLTNFVRTLPPQPDVMQKMTKRPFVPPQPAPGELEDNGECADLAPALRNELVFDRNSSASLRLAMEALKRESMDLETQIRQLQDTIDALIRQQNRAIEGQLYNKVNETQEDLSIGKFDLRAKQLHLAAIRAQKELFVSKIDPGSPRGERKLSAATAPSMKTKWLKAIKSLKPASGSAVQGDRRNGAGGSSSQPLRPNEDGSHHLQEYTYKKITACDVCSQILRGHTRQGLRCRICKLNAHGDCAAQLPRCQPKQKLLRRQKSTSELENRADVEEEIEEDVGSEMKANTSSNGTVPPSATLAAGKFRQKTPFIERIAQLADKSVQNAAKDGSSQLDIPIVNVPECPERVDRPAATAIGSVNVSMAGGRGARSGVRPPPVHMPILGVQLQQQELSQQWSGAGGGGLPVPSQDISSSSDYRRTSILEMPSMASMTTAAYLSGGIGINYYATSATMLYRTGTATTATSLGCNQQSAHYPHLTGQQLQPTSQMLPTDTGLRRRLFAGFRPMSGFGRSRSRSSQHRSISLPETPHSPRRQKLNLRMKSLSLDSPESSELHGQIRRRQQPAPGPSTAAAGSHYHGGSGGHLEHSTPPSNNSRLHSPSSPSHQGRKLLYASRGMRGGSVDLPDDMEKSQSSASTSPCPSPVRHVQKSHRLLPTNLYVILYNFKARHADELDLKAGYKVTVVDTSDPDWWKGKVLGRVGYFPSKYCVRLNANEKPFQVTHNLQVSDGERGENMTLLRDQIVIQTSDEVNGMVMVRSADNRQGYCPIKYLQEV